MIGKLSPREFEALSAYLDGELSPSEKARIEEKIKTDANLRAEMLEIKKTRILLRSQPRLRAPRNFTLTAQMAGVRAGSPARMGAYPVLRLASMLAALFFIIVLAGDLVGSSLQPSTIAMSDTVQPAPLAMPGFGMGGGGGGGDASELAPAAAQPAAETREMPEIEAMAEAPAAVMSEDTTLREAPGEAAPGPSIAEAAATEAAAVAPAAKEAAQSPASAGEAQQAAAPEVQAQLSAENQAGSIAATNAWSFLRILQTILALIALVTGAAALALRKRLI